MTKIITSIIIAITCIVNGMALDYNADSWARCHIDNRVDIKGVNNTIRLIDTYEVDHITVIYRDNGKRKTVNLDDYGLDTELFPQEMIEGLTAVCEDYYQADCIWVTLR